MKYKQNICVILTYLSVLSAFFLITFLASEATVVVAHLIPLERMHTFVIDPGHGGIDGGATSCSGILESQFNLQISLKLRDLLHLLGYRTVMIRTEDISVYTSGETIAAKKISDLRQRVKMVSQEDSPILVSIHQNTFSDSRYHGPQVFYGTKADGESLAKTLQKSLTDSLCPGSNRMAKNAEGVYLMEHIDCTGVLIECGFLSNPEEEARLRSNSYQQKLSGVIGVALVNFLDG